MRITIDVKGATKAQLTRGNRDGAQILLGTLIHNLPFAIFTTWTLAAAQKQILEDCTITVGESDDA